MKWVFGGDSDKAEQNEEFSQSAQTMSDDEAGVSLDYDDIFEPDESAIFDDPSDLNFQEPTSEEVESVETPDRHAQQSLISKIRKDIEDFDYHITQNELHLKHSREQLDGFKSFVQATDVEMEQIHRLRRLNQELTSKVVADDLGASELQQQLEAERANLAATRNRNNEYKEVLAAARNEIISLVKRDGKLRDQLEQYAKASSKREAKMLEVARQSERHIAENKVLGDSLQRAQFELDNYRKNATELQKKLDEQLENGRQDRAEFDRMAASVASTTETLEKYQADNIELRSKLDNLITENQATEKRSIAKVRVREEELFSLRSQVEGLQSELRVRNQMLTQAVDEAKTARSEMKSSSAMAQSATEQLTREIKEHEEQRLLLTTANTEIAEVNKRFNEMLGELEQSRRENLHLKRMLKAERQMFEQSINSLPTAKAEAKEGSRLSEMADQDNSKLN